MTPRLEIIAADCVAKMRAMPAASVDAIVTDPPYEIAFMGKGWDNAGIAFDVETWRAALHVLKPGGHLLAFGATRTYHRMAVAIEDAGFEIRDSIHWIYGTGFPKSLNVAKAIDKAKGVQGTLGGPKSEAHAGWIARGTMRGGEGHAGWQNPWNDDPEAVDRNAREYFAGSDEAQRFTGWGTALKPAHEPIIVARKPLSEKTVAANVLEHGTGALNIDASRIGSDVVGWGGKGRSAEAVSTSTSLGGTEPGGYGFADGAARPVQGRFPANVIFDTDAAAELDAQSGTSQSPPVGNSFKKQARKSGSRAGADREQEFENGYGDAGGASRFFYVAKPSKAERNRGLPAGEKNTHPTVKPVQLMRYLVRLVTPPGGTVLDPFCGSGTTALAACLEGFEALCIDQAPEYAELAEKRTAGCGS